MNSITHDLPGIKLLEEGVKQTSIILRKVIQNEKDIVCATLITTSEASFSSLLNVFKALKKRGYNYKHHINKHNHEGYADLKVVKNTKEMQSEVHFCIRKIEAVRSGYEHDIKKGR